MDNTQWEYGVIDGNFEAADALKIFLNEMGEIGWENYQIDAIGTTSRKRFYFKRVNITPHAEKWIDDCVKQRTIDVLSKITRAKLAIGGIDTYIGEYDTDNSRYISYTPEQVYNLVAQ